MRNLKLSLIPLKISLITTIVFIFCLAYLNITISEKYKVQVKSAIEANQNAARYLVQSTLSQAKPVDFGKMFNELEKERDTAYTGIHRIDIIDENNGKILSSTTPGEIGKNYNRSILEIIKSGKNNQTFILENDSQNKNVELVFERFLQIGNYSGLLLVLLNDNEVFLEKTRSFSLLMFIISFFATLIIFFSIFLITGKLSMNIKQIANAIDNLLADIPDVQIPKSNDELGVLGQKVVNLKELLTHKNEKIASLEQVTQLLKDKKFEIEKSEFNTIEGVFCRVNLSGMQERLEKQKIEVRNEFLTGVIELFQDNITKANGKILNFDGGSFLLFYDVKDDEVEAVKNLIRIKKTLYLYISQYDISSKFEIEFSATLIQGIANVSRLKSGSLDFKTVMGKTISYLSKIAQNSGNDDIVIATGNEDALKKAVNLKPLNNPIKEIPHTHKVFYVDVKTDLGGDKTADKKSNSDTNDDNKDGKNENLLSSILEDTFNNEYF